jgi:hypothetical protein
MLLVLDIFVKQYLLLETCQRLACPVCSGYGCLGRASCRAQTLLLLCVYQPLFGSLLLVVLQMSLELFKADLLENRHFLVEFECGLCQHAIQKCALP